MRAMGSASPLSVPCVQALHYAAVEGDHRMAQMLLDAGLVIDSADQQGWTCLHRATQQKDLAMMKLLLAKGADPNVHDGARSRGGGQCCRRGEGVGGAEGGRGGRRRISGGAYRGRQAERVQAGREKARGGKAKREIAVRGAKVGVRETDELTDATRCV